MDVNTAIKNIKAEMKTVKAENKYYEDKQVTEYIKQISEGIKETESLVNEMLDLDRYTTGYNYRDSMKSNINWCYHWLADCYFRFYMNQGSGQKQEMYAREEDRLKACQI